MKTIGLFLLLFWGGLVNLFAQQDTTYRPFPTDSAMWVYSTSYLPGWAIGTEYTIYLMIGDTTIKGKKYSKIYAAEGYQEFHSSNRDSVIKEHFDPIVTYIAAFREENRRTYYLPHYDASFPEDTAERMIFDFNVRDKDTVVLQVPNGGPVTNYRQIMHRGNGGFDSVTLEVQRDNNGRIYSIYDGGRYIMFNQNIQGIGSTAGDFFVAAPPSLLDFIYSRFLFDGTQCKLSYQSSNPDDIYQEVLKKCFKYKYTGIQDKVSSQNMVIYPNPVINRLQLNLTNAQPYLLTIYDLNSRILFQLETSESNLSIDTQNFPSGVYLVKVFYPASNRLFTTKFIIR